MQSDRAPIGLRFVAQNLRRRETESTFVDFTFRHCALKVHLNLRSEDVKLATRCNSMGPLGYR